MEFFPHRVPPKNIANAVSASNAAEATFLANLPSTIVNSVSSALNISGSAGTSGTSFSIAGAQGAQGTTGLKGTRGKNIYLLAATRSPDYPGFSCIAYQMYEVGPDTGQCDITLGEGTYYATGSIGTWQVGTPIYTNSACTNTIKGTNTLHATLGDYYTTSGGKISTINSCTS